MEGTRGTQGKGYEGHKGHKGHDLLGAAPIVAASIEKRSAVYPCNTALPS